MQIGAMLYLSICPDVNLGRQAPMKGFPFWEAFFVCTALISEALYCDPLGFPILITPYFIVFLKRNQ